MFIKEKHYDDLQRVADSEYQKKLLEEIPM